MTSLAELHSPRLPIGEQASLPIAFQADWAGQGGPTLDVSGGH